MRTWQGNEGRRGREGAAIPAGDEPHLEASFERRRFFISPWISQFSSWCELPGSVTSSLPLLFSFLSEARLSAIERRKIEDSMRELTISPPGPPALFTQMRVRLAPVKPKSEYRELSSRVLRFMLILGAFDEHMNYRIGSAKVSECDQPSRALRLTPTTLSRALARGLDGCFSWPRLVLGRLAAGDGEKGTGHLLALLQSDPVVIHCAVQAASDHFPPPRFPFRLA